VPKTLEHMVDTVLAFSGKLAGIFYRNVKKVKKV
jgi:predicted ATP-dependent serine protease